jgi:hypothetical protein
MMVDDATLSAFRGAVSSSSRRTSARRLVGIGCHHDRLAGDHEPSAPDRRGLGWLGWLVLRSGLRVLSLGGSSQSQAQDVHEPHPDVRVTIGLHGLQRTHSANLLEARQSPMARLRRPWKAVHWRPQTRRSASGKVTARRTIRAGSSRRRLNARLVVAGLTLSSAIHAGIADAEQRRVLTLHAARREAPIPILVDQALQRALGQSLRENLDYWRVRRHAFAGPLVARSGTS